MYYKRTETRIQESGLFNLGQGECLYNRLARRRSRREEEEQEEKKKEKEEG